MPALADSRTQNIMRVGRRPYRSRLPVKAKNTTQTAAAIKQREVLQEETEKTHQNQTEEAKDSSSDEYPIFKLGERSSKPIEVSLIVNGKRLTMELDTGAAVSIISEATRKELFPVHPSNILLKMYTEEQIRLMGNLHVRVQYGDQAAKLLLEMVPACLAVTG